MVHHPWGIWWIDTLVIRNTQNIINISVNFDENSIAVLISPMVLTSWIRHRLYHANTQEFWEINSIGTPNARFINWQSASWMALYSIVCLPWTDWHDNEQLSRLDSTNLYSVKQPTASFLLQMILHQGTNFITNQIMNIAINNVDTIVILLLIVYKRPHLYLSHLSQICCWL